MFGKREWETLNKWVELDDMCGKRSGCEGCPVKGKYGDDEDECLGTILQEQGEAMRLLTEYEDFMQFVKDLAWKETERKLHGRAED